MFIMSNMETVSEMLHSWLMMQLTFTTKQSQGALLACMNQRSLGMNTDLLSFNPGTDDFTIEQAFKPVIKESSIDLSPKQFKCSVFWILFVGTNSGSSISLSEVMGNVSDMLRALVFPWSLLAVVAIYCVM